PQMPGNGGGLQVEQMCQLLYAARLIGKQTQDAQPRLVSQCLEIAQEGLQVRLFFLGHRTSGCGWRLPDICGMPSISRMLSHLGQHPIASWKCIERLRDQRLW